MIRLNGHRVLAVLALLLMAGTVSGCGCGPLGLGWCGRGGGYYGGGGGFRGPEGPR